MRRKEKEITEMSKIEDVIHKSIVCHIGLSNHNYPYIIPMCFGYKDNVIYVHSSTEGKKIDILKENNNVCFEFETNIEIMRDEKACRWSMKYQSVIGFGKAYFLEEINEKREAFNLIMEQYSDKTFQFLKEAISKTTIVKIEIESMTGKQSGF